MKKEERCLQCCHRRELWCCYISSYTPLAHSKSRMFQTQGMHLIYCVAYTVCWEGICLGGIVYGTFISALHPYYYKTCHFLSILLTLHYFYGVGDINSKARYVC